MVFLYPVLCCIFLNHSIQAAQELLYNQTDLIGSVLDKNSAPRKKARYSDESALIGLHYNLMLEKLRIKEKYPKMYRYWTRPCVQRMIDHYAQSHDIIADKILLDLIKQNKNLIQEMKQFEGKSNLVKLDFLYTKKDDIYKQFETFGQPSSYFAWPYVTQIHKIKKIQSIWTVR